MLALFRTNKFFANIFLLFYILLLWASIFFVEHEIIPSSGSYFYSLIDYLLEEGSLRRKMLALIFVFLQAVFINYLVGKQKMTEDITLLPGVFFILFSSFSPQFFDLSPQMFGNFFLILALNEIFGTYNKYSCADSIYNIGLWIGLASLFYISYAVMLLLAWLGLGVMRAIKLKERLMMIVGFLSPYALVMTYKYWTDDLANFYNIQFSKNVAFLDFVGDYSIHNLYVIGFFILCVLVAFLSMKIYSYRMKISIQKSLNILYMFLAISILTLLFQKSVNIQHILVLIPALSILISINFVKMPSHWGEILHLGMLVSVLAWQFFPLLNF